MVDAQRDGFDEEVGVFLDDDSSNLAAGNRVKIVCLLILSHLILEMNIVPSLVHKNNSR